MLPFSALQQLPMVDEGGEVCSCEILAADLRGKTFEVLPGEI